MTDIDIGVVALESLEALVAAGMSFTWADQQAPENRSPDLYGIPISPWRSLRHSAAISRSRVEATWASPTRSAGVQEKLLDGLSSDARA